jgi:[acyl-carrier-protein] S-malonyltransferase
MIVAAVFPGQGCEEPGAGVDWASDPLVLRAGDLAGVDSCRAIQRFTKDLSRTSVLQPVLVALSLACWQSLLARDVRPTIVAGHSVVEVAAWAASGAIDPSAAVELAAARGVALEKSAREHPGGMIAVGRDVDPRDLPGVGGPLVIAATNGPSQRVLSGSLAAIAAVERLTGGRRLAVSGAWHSPFMAAAAEAVAHAQGELRARPAERTLVTSLDGRALESFEPPQLAAQLTAPVEWESVQRTFLGLGVTDVVCLAPGRVMRGLARSQLGDRVRVHLADSLRDLDRIAAALASRPQERAS